MSAPRTSLVIPVVPIYGEEWRQVFGASGYEVSSLGRLRSWLGRGANPFKALRPEPRLLVQAVDRRGYFVIGFNRAPPRTVHSVVLEAFVCPRPLGAVTRHLNGNQKDNRIENLAWGTPKENNADQIRHGTQVMGERHGSTKVSEAQVRKLRDLRADGMTVVAAAAATGIAPSNANNICLGKTWKHLPLRRGTPPIDLPGELWRSVVGLDGLYDVSNMGRMRSLWNKGRARETPLLLKPDNGADTSLRDRNGRRVRLRLGRAVLEAFVGPRRAGMEASHVNGNGGDNRVENLVWETHAENDARRRTRGPVTKPGAKLTADEVRRIRKLRSDGVGLRVLGGMFGVGESTVSRVARGEFWADVT